MCPIPLFPSSLPSCDKSEHMSLEIIKISANAPVLSVVFPNELHGNLIFIFDPKDARGSTLSSASFKMLDFEGTDKIVGKLFWEIKFVRWAYIRFLCLVHAWSITRPWGLGGLTLPEKNVTSFNLPWPVGLCCWKCYSLNVWCFGRKTMQVRYLCVVF